LKGLINRSGPVWPQAIMLNSNSFNVKKQVIVLSFNSMRGI
jgi:hypothetical protein